jgi:MFS family permease
VVFAGNGALFASLFSRMPEVQERLGLDEGELGLALLGAPVGLIAAVTLAGAGVVRAGSRRVSAIGAAAYVAVLALPAFVPGVAGLLGAMVLLGAATGTLDVAMNAQGVTVERRYPRRMFASLHAAFSFGALAGALSGGLIAEAGVALGTHLVAVSVVGGIVLALAVRGFAPDAPEARSGPAFARPSRLLLGLGVVALCALLAEGAMNDWSAVYLDEVHGAGPATAAAGLAVFSAAMGAGRLAGDAIAERVGAGGWRAAASCWRRRAWPARRAPRPRCPPWSRSPCSASGWRRSSPCACARRPASPACPRARRSRRSPPRATWGFLAGPPVVGLVADASSLRISLLVVGALCLLAAGLAGGVRDPQRSSRRHERRSTGHAASRKASAKAARIAQ